MGAVDEEFEKLADRIAQLTAELAEARLLIGLPVDASRESFIEGVRQVNYNLNRRQEWLDEARAMVRVERAAHESTKAELARYIEAMHDNAVKHERTENERDLRASERDAAIAQLAKVRHDRDEMIRVHDEVEARELAVQAELKGTMRALRKQAAKHQRRQREMAGERDAATAREQAAQADAAAMLTKIEYYFDYPDSRCNSGDNGRCVTMQQLFGAVGRDKSTIGRAILDRIAEAESAAAAMRLAVEPAFDEYIGRGEEPVSLESAYAVFRDSSAGRALAARVPLLEAVATAARHMRTIHFAGDDAAAAWHALNEAVAALDEKGPTS